MRIDFTKMHGAGNDFVVIDARGTTLALTSAQARHIADRQRGIGCDQILIVHDAKPASRRADFAYRIHNAEGGEVQQCGNGARALALFGRDGKDELLMASPSGPVRARFSGNQISVDMGPAHFEPAALPMTAAATLPEYTVDLENESLRFGAVSMGNPHAVLTVNNVTTANVVGVGTALQRHAMFPESVNVGFMQIVSDRQIALRVFERGVGETLACGTGACAAVAIGHARGDLADEVAVALPGGELMVNCAQPHHAIWLTGPAHVAFKGHIEL